MKYLYFFLVGILYAFFNCLMNWKLESIHGFIDGKTGINPYTLDILIDLFLFSLFVVMGLLFFKLYLSYVEKFFYGLILILISLTSLLIFNYYRFQTYKMFRGIMLYGVVGIFIVKTVVMAILISFIRHKHSKKNDDADLNTLDHPFPK